MKKKGSYFKNKRITVMGLGLLGRGIGDAEFLARQGAELIVTDLKTESELLSSVKRLQGFKNIHFSLGGHKLEDFRNRDFILKAAGVPLRSPYLEEAQKNNIPIEMSTALFADLSGARIVGITGTRGKSTVTFMVFEALQKEKKAGRLKGNVFLGGNVRGLSTLALLEDVCEDDMVVLELDSWQLQGFRTRKISPHISVFTTFMPDHMNYYNNDLRAYFYDKSAIYEFQKAGDALIVTEFVAEKMAEFKMGTSHSNILVVRPDSFNPDQTLLVPGEHNRYNAELARGALRFCGVDDVFIHDYLSEFKGVPGRLEKIAEKKGKVFYNDTTATTPEAATAAINALNESVITLIAGGSDKGLDFSKFIEVLEKIKTIILLPGEGTKRLLNESNGTLSDKVILVRTMKEAVSKADSLSQAGEIVLLSPGCASFGLFINEFDRGDQFVRAVQEL